MSKFLKVSLGIISVITLLSLNFGFANAEEVPDTKKSERLDWKCELNEEGQNIVRYFGFTSGKPDRENCPVYQGQQSTCKELGDGDVVCVYTPAGSPPAQSGGQASTQGDFYWTINGGEPGQTDIDGNTPKVTLKFFGLDPEAGIAYVYRRTDQENANSGRKLNDEATIASDGTITLEVCGAGPDALKAKDIGSNRDCKTDGSDFFHEGNMYRLGLYDDEFGEAQIMVANFYVRRSVPTIKISPVDSGNLTSVRVNLSGRRSGGNNRNNYQMVLENGRDYKEERCATTNNESDPKKTIALGDQKDFLSPPISGNAVGDTFTNEGSGGIPNGDYVLKVNDQNEEAGPDSDGCQGGFTYFQIPVSLSGGEIELGEPEFDPKGEEYEAFLKDLASLNKTGVSLSFPCGEGVSFEPLSKCLSIKTAIGDIEVIPERFVGSVFRFVLMIATFGAIILLIYSGYLFMMSSGDKEKLAGARETITSAIVGLLFIILSFVVLEIIGFDILRIPGFFR